MYLNLAYHLIGDPNGKEAGTDPVFTISPAQFAEQIAVITEMQVPVISQTEFVHRLKHQIAATAPTLILSFDDGNRSDLEVAVPLLEGRFPAIFYLTVAHIGKRLPTSAVKEMLDRGFEIGNHGWTHRYMDNLGEEDLFREMKDARAYLEELGGHPVQHFAYPGGRWNAKTSRILQASGYHSAVNTDPRTNSEQQDPFKIRRVAVRNTFDMTTFANIILQDPATMKKLARRAQWVALIRKITGDTGLDWIRKQRYATY